MGVSNLAANVEEGEAATGETRGTEGVGGLELSPTVGVVGTMEETLAGVATGMGVMTAGGVATTGVTGEGVEFLGSGFTAAVGWIGVGACV